MGDGRLTRRHLEGLAGGCGDDILYKRAARDALHWMNEAERLREVMKCMSPVPAATLRADLDALTKRMDGIGEQQRDHYQTLVAHARSVMLAGQNSERLDALTERVDEIRERQRKRANHGYRLDALSGRVEALHTLCEEHHGAIEELEEADKVPTPERTCGGCADWPWLDCPKWVHPVCKRYEGCDERPGHLYASGHACGCWSPRGEG